MSVFLNPLHSRTFCLVVIFFGFSLLKVAWWIAPYCAAAEGTILLGYEAPLEPCERLHNSRPYLIGFMLTTSLKVLQRTPTGYSRWHSGTQLCGARFTLHAQVCFRAAMGHILFLVRWSSPCATFIVNWCWISYFMCGLFILPHYSGWLGLFNMKVQLWHILGSVSLSVVIRVGWGRRKGDPGNTHIHTSMVTSLSDIETWCGILRLRYPCMTAECPSTGMADDAFLSFFEPWLDLFANRQRCICVDWLILRHIRCASYNSKVDLNSVSVLLWRRLLTKTTVRYCKASMFLTLARNRSVLSQNERTPAGERWNLDWISARQQGTLKAVQLYDPPSPSIHT